MTAFVEGSWGRLEVDTASGAVLRLTDEPASYIDNGVEERGYRDIVRVDLVEWRKAYPNEEFEGCDILDIGYWIADGTYEPPVDDWRADFRNAQGFVFKPDAAVLFKADK